MSDHARLIVNFNVICIKFNKSELDYAQLCPHSEVCEGDKGSAIGFTRRLLRTLNHSWLRWYLEYPTPVHDGPPLRASDGYGPPQRP